MIQYIVILGFIVAQMGVLVYVRDTLRGETQPNRVSFFLWTLAPFIGVAAALSDGVTWAVLPVFSAGFGPFMVFLASFVNKKAYWKTTQFDWICGALSLLALVLWQVTENPSVAILFAILEDLAAAIPILKKAWTHPHSETYALYLAAIFNQCTAFLAMKSYRFVEVAFPAYLLLICIVIASIIIWGRRCKPLESAS